MRSWVNESPVTAKITTFGECCMAYWYDDEDDNDDDDIEVDQMTMVEKFNITKRWDGCFVFAMVMYTGYRGM